MKDINPHKKHFALNGLLSATIGLGGLCSTTPLSAQCGIDIMEIVVQPNCDMEDGSIQLLFNETAEIYSIEWSTGDMGSILTDLGAGYYSVTVLDWNQCETTAEFYLQCEEDDPGGGLDDDCTMNTFTQGGWGSPPNGNNPGAYLHANFAAAFPNGLTIGCTRQLKLTSAQAITNYLPGGGPAAMLPQGITTDPTKSKNVLASQLVAATLNVGMDAYDAGFGQSGNMLGNTTIASGPFAGLSVDQLLDMANSFIGGCATGGFSASQYNEALSSINENFNGGADNGYLLCQPPTKRMLEPNRKPRILSIHPNPASHTMVVTIDIPPYTGVQAEIVDITGRTVSPVLFTSNMSGNVERTVDVSGMKEGIYFVRLSSGASISAMRFAVAH